MNDKLIEQYAGDLRLIKKLRKVKVSKKEEQEILQWYKKQEQKKKK